MMNFTKFAAAGAALMAFATASAADAAVYLGLQQDGGAIVTQDVDPSAVSYAGAFGNFEVNFFSGTAGIYPQLLGSVGQTQNTGGNAGTLDVYVTVTDITELPDGFLSSFAVNSLPTGWSITETTYADAGNGLYGGAVLAQKVFSGIGTFVSTNTNPVVSGPYSLTARYTVVAPNGGEALGTVKIAAVPEPGTWALMIMGFGGAGSMIRRRRVVFA